MVCLDKIIYYVFGNSCKLYILILMIFFRYKKMRIVMLYLINGCVNYFVINDFFVFIWKMF